MIKRGIPPAHPGTIIRSELIEQQGLTVKAAADMLGVTRAAFSNVVNGKAAISPEMAVRIATVFGGTPDIWIRLQTRYDLQKAEAKVKRLHLKPFKHHQGIPAHA